MNRTYQLRVHRDERVGALIEAQLYRTGDDGELTLVAEVDTSYAALGIGDIFDALTDHLIVHQDEHGQLP